MFPPCNIVEQAIYKFEVDVFKDHVFDHSFSSSENQNTSRTMAGGAIETHIFDASQFNTLFAAYGRNMDRFTVAPSITRAQPGLNVDI